MVKWKMPWANSNQLPRITWNSNINFLPMLTVHLHITSDGVNECLDDSEGLKGLFLSLSMAFAVTTQSVPHVSLYWSDWTLTSAPQHAGHLRRTLVVNWAMMSTKKYCIVIEKMSERNRKTHWEHLQHLREFEWDRFSVKWAIEKRIIRTSEI